jgi:hypothetical protein
VTAILQHRIIALHARLRLRREDLSCVAAVALREVMLNAWLTRRHASDRPELNLPRHPRWESRTHSQVRLSSSLRTVWVIHSIEVDRVISETLLAMTRHVRRGERILPHIWRHGRHSRHPRESTTWHGCMLRWRTHSCCGWRLVETSLHPGTYWLLWHGLSQH